MTADAPERTSRWRRYAWRLFAAILVGGAVYYVRGQWPAALNLAHQVHPRWDRIAISFGLVLLTYAVLIETWRQVLRQVGGELTLAEAAYVWLVSNLARYLPGSLWQIGALSTLARRHGIPIANTTTAALVMTVANVVTGLVLFSVLGVARLPLDHRSQLFLALGIAGLCVAPLAAARSGPILTRLLRRPVVIPRLSARAVAVALGGTLLGWIGYGLAFQFLATGLLPDTSGTAGAAGYIATYTGAYLAGFLSIAPPAGLGVAEAAMVRLGPLFGIATGPQAALLAIGVRIWRTILEIAPGAVALALPVGRRRRSS